MLNITLEPEQATPPPVDCIEILNCDNTVKLVITVESQPLDVLNTSV